MEVSFRPALTFPHTPARSPLAPESSREPNPAPPSSRHPFSRPLPPTPSAVHRAPPRAPIPCGSSERMFCHHTTLHTAPNSPSNRPGLLAPSLPALLPPSRRLSAPRRRGRYTRNHVHTSNFRFRYPKCFLCTCMRFIVDVEGGLVSIRVRACLCSRYRKASKRTSACTKAHACERVSMCKHFFDSTDFFPVLQPRFEML